MHARQLTAELFAALVVFAAAMFVVNPVSAQERERTQTTAGIAYVSGGIGIDSRDALAAREKDFNLKLVLTITGTGTYVSDVALTITGQSGKPVLQHTAQGPLFMAKLPEGSYTLTATFRGQTQTRTFLIRANRMQREYLRWPARAGEDWTMPWGAP